MPFRDFFLSSVLQLLRPSLKKSDAPLRGHATLRNRMSGQNWTKSGILHSFVYKILLFLNCFITPFAWSGIKIHFWNIKNHKTLRKSLIRNQSSLFNTGTYEIQVGLEKSLGKPLVRNKSRLSWKTPNSFMPVPAFHICTRPSIVLYPSCDLT